MGVVESSETAATKLLNWGFGRGQDAIAVGSLDEPPVTPATPQVVPYTDTTPQSAAVEAATAGEPVRSGGAAVAVWVVVGLALTLSGWWLQRRRPSATR